MRDHRSREFVLVPFCCLAQAFQARGLVRGPWRGIIAPVLEELLHKDVNVIQMPCPEALFGGLTLGLTRQPMSYAQYDTPEFREHCRQLAQGVAEQVESLLRSGYAVKAILGLEYSPSCAASLQYTRRGTVHRQGIFVEELCASLSARQIDVPVIGINKRGISASLSRLRDALSKQGTLL
jgi:predicted secreted protein